MEIPKQNFPDSESKLACILSPVISGDLFPILLWY